MLCRRDQSHRIFIERWKSSEWTTLASKESGTRGSHACKWQPPKKSAAARSILFLVSLSDEGLHSCHVDGGMAQRLWCCAARKSSAPPCTLVYPVAPSAEEKELSREFWISKPMKAWHVARFMQIFPFSSSDCLMVKRGGFFYPK